MFSPDYSKRDYLLPTGCKDLIDALRLQSPQISWPVGQPMSPMSPPKGDILVSTSTTVGDLAAMLGQKPFTIIADAMELGIFTTVKGRLEFEKMAQIARKYGFTARKAL